MVASSSLAQSARRDWRWMSLACKHSTHAQDIAALTVPLVLQALMSNYCQLMVGAKQRTRVLQDVPCL